MRLLESGVAIHLYEADFLNAKHMRVDDDICGIGSSNLGMRSFELNAEVSLICYGNKTANDLKNVENQYLDESMTVDFESRNERSLPKSSGKQRTDAQRSAVDFNKFSATQIRS